ncbi:type III-A CRISPR-associated RAMP protein Csm4 [Candidatus Bathyarchaeota archaeon]|nr:type III-A CRISPR-associated RAMP protein Csm4 [Candidatus Bathyarchaeota archaeon]
MKREMTDHRMTLVFYQESPFRGIIDSIKLQGAILHAFSVLFPGKINGFKRALDSGNVAISSPLPMVDGTTYYHKPCLPLKLDVNSPQEIFLVKKFKKLAFIKLSHVGRAIEKGYYDHDLILEIIEQNPTLEDLFQIVEKPGLEIESMTKKPNLYYKSDFFYTSREFSILLDLSGYTQEIMACIKFLGDQGISKRRSLGHGRFHLKETNESKPPPEHSGTGMRILLSKFIPCTGDMTHVDLNHSYFNIHVMNGYTSTGTHFGNVRMFTEGSVFSTRQRLQGCLIDFNGQYSINGTPFFM